MYRQNKTSKIYGTINKGIQFEYNLCTRNVYIQIIAQKINDYTGIFK